MITGEIISWMLGIFGSIVIVFLSFTITKLNRTIERLEVQVNALEKFATAQNEINKQTEKLAFIIERIEAKQQQNITEIQELRIEHKQFHRHNKADE